MYKKLLLIALLMVWYTSVAEVRIICTAALVERDYHARKQQYIKSLKHFKQNGISVYVIESCQKGPTFLNDYCDNVYYAQSNLPQYTPGVGNYGINELIALKKGLEYFNFDPDDIIIKFTGRYYLEKMEFIHLVQGNQHVDAIVRAWNDDFAYTALFAIKVRHLAKFLENALKSNFTQMAAGRPIECIFGSYISHMKRQGLNIIYIPKVYDYLPIWTATRYRPIPLTVDK